MSISCVRCLDELSYFDIINLYFVYSLVENSMNLHCANIDTVLKQVEHVLQNASRVIQISLGRDDDDYNLHVCIHERLITPIYNLSHILVAFMKILYFPYYL